MLQQPLHKEDNHGGHKGGKITRECESQEHTKASFKANQSPPRPKRSNKVWIETHVRLPFQARIDLGDLWCMKDISRACTTRAIKTLSNVWYHRWYTEPFWGSRYTEHHTRCMLVPHVWEKPRSTNQDTQNLKAQNNLKIKIPKTSKHPKSRKN